ncbi:hypothetical protein L3I74_000840 [Vibrio parahaemolyticus]|nr:hypothetical protein [Vibrio parahaemolyticus]
MELDKFVAKTLTMISKGVHDAQSECEKYGSIVNDSPDSMRHSSGMYGSNSSMIQNVEFDVAIVTEDTSNGEGKISVLGVGLGASNQSKDTYTSRVKFTIPMSFSQRN